MTTQISLPTQGTQTLKLTEKTTAAVRSGAKAAGRMLFVDNLRVFLTILVVLHHLAITYGAGGSWSYMERPTSELTEIILSLLTTLDHFFFMGAFFLIAGYFVPGSLDRKGTMPFLKDRLVRLGIPFLVFSYLLSPITSYIWDMQHWITVASFPMYYVGALRSLRFSTGPLWFVEALLVFSAVYAIGRAVLNWTQSKRIEIRAMAGSAVQRPLTHRMILAFVLILVPTSFATRIFFPLDTAWNNLQFSMFPQYILLFAAGILAYRREWLPDLPDKVRKVWSIAAAACILALPVIMVTTGAIEDDAPFKGGLTVQSLLLSTWEAIYCPAMIILLLSLFRKRFDRQGTTSRFLSKNAYSVYIIHAPVIVVLAWLLRDVSIYPLLKYVLVVPIAVSLCFLTSSLIRRLPLTEKVL
jgi:surface polysaccharide O-acyltransferase-like enzyme